MSTEKGKIYKTCSKWCPFIRTQAWSRFLHSSMASSMTVCPKSDHTATRRCFSSLTSICASAKQSRRQAQILWSTRFRLGYQVARHRKKSNQVWPGANTLRWHVHDGPARCNSTGLGLWECVGCHGNSCSWYSVVWIIFMVNYQVMLHEQFDQMALILVDVCENYWT